MKTAYNEQFEMTWDPQLGLGNVRFVVLDTESTGLDVDRDQLVSIGAVGVINDEVRIEDHFEVVIPIQHNTSAVFYHGITREEASAGVPEPEALEQFLTYLKDGVIVGHHIGHDILMLNRAIERNFGFELQNLAVDTMDLALKLDSVLGVAPDERPDFSLDGLCRRFGILPHDRHTASGDAFLTSQIFLRLLRSARKGNLTRLGDLLSEFEGHR